MKTEKKFLRVELILGLSLLMTSHLFGADYYVTPAGAGTQDGSDWANALPQASLSDQVARLVAGDQLYLGSGNYAGIGTLAITSSGTSSDPITITGVDTGDGLPVLSDTWSEDDPAEGVVCFSFQDASSHWRVRDIKVMRYRNAIRLGAEAVHTDIIVDNVDAEYAQDPIWIESADACTFTNIDVAKYTKKGIRLRAACTNVTVSHCVADASGGDPDWYNKTEGIVMGFFCDDQPGISDITFENCIARHNKQNNQSRNYPNGDGFCSEGLNSNVRYVNCQAYDNQDGGFDCKASNTTFEGCVAFGNYRNYRYWLDNATMNNCLSGYATDVGLWVNSGAVAVTNSTFVGDTKAVRYEAAGSATFANTIFWQSDAVPTCDDCPTDDPQFVNPVGPSWRGVPADAYHSTRYPNQGYTAALTSMPPVITNLIASPTTGDTPLTVTFNLSVNDPDGSVSSYRWDFGDGATSSQEAPTHVFTAPGNYTVRVTVQDDTQQSATDQITVAVGGNAPPTVAWVSPQHGSRFAENGSVTLTANATDTDGTVARVEFFDGTTKLGETTTAPYTVAIEKLSEGTHSLEARATDSDGGVTAETITVAGVGVPTVDIQRTATAPVIDGAAEHSWGGYPAYWLENVTAGEAPASPSELSATWQARWDDTNLYVLVTVTDDNLSNDSGEQFWKDDGVEVYLDINYDQPTAYGDNDYQSIFRYNDEDVRGKNALAEVTFAQGESTSGYVIEAQFPWASLGTSAQSDMIVGIDVAVSDDDAGGDRERKLAWHATDDSGFENPAVWGAARLTEVSNPPTSSGAAYPNGVPLTLPGRLEAEHYDTQGAGVSYYDTSEGNSGEDCRSDDVDVAAYQEGGCAVGWIQAGEWLAYTVNVPTAGTYTVETRAATLYPDRRLEIVTDRGQGARVEVRLPKTGGWNSWKTTVVEGLELEAGVQTLRLNMLTSHINLDYVEIILGTASRTTVGPKVKLREDSLVNMRAHPNPWRTHNLTVSGLSTSLPSHVSVYGPDGRLLYHTTVDDRKIELSKSLISVSGVYTVSVVSGASRQSVQIVVE